jgi:hypothetical protein
MLNKQLFHKGLMSGFPNCYLIIDTPPEQMAVFLLYKTYLKIVAKHFRQRFIKAYNFFSGSHIVVIYCIEICVESFIWTNAINIHMEKYYSICTRS